MASGISVNTHHHTLRWLLLTVSESTPQLIHWVMGMFSYEEDIMGACIKITQSKNLTIFSRFLVQWWLEPRNSSPKSGRLLTVMKYSMAELLFEETKEAVAFGNAICGFAPRTISTESPQELLILKQLLSELKRCIWPQWVLKNIIGQHYGVCLNILIRFGLIQILAEAVSN